MITADQLVAHAKESSVMDDLTKTAESTPIDTTDPIMLAWKQFEATDEFKNALRWAVATHYDDGRPILDADRIQHAKGAMWLAFTKGMQG